MKTVKKKRISNKSQQDDSALLLSERGAKILLEVLRNPPKPNEALKNAFRKYERLVKKGKIITSNFT